jgi:hypothetical protein
MSLLTLFRRLLGSVGTSAFEQNMDEELRHHLELETEALVARGLPRRRATLLAGASAASRW